MATAQKGVTLGPEATYVALIVVLIGAVFLSYVTKALPNNVGLGAIAAFIPLIVGQVTHDLTDLHNASTNGPKWLTFVVVSVASAALASVGLFTGLSTLTTVAGLGWVMAMLQYAFHYIAADNGASIPIYFETWATALIGIALSVLGAYINNPMLSSSAMITTLLNAVSSGLTVTQEGGQITVTPNPPAKT